MLYAIVSRRHQKWYMGMHEQLRTVNGRQVPGHHERRYERTEGMVHPTAARNTGAKYRLWKPYEIWDQCMIPLAVDTEERIKKVEDYSIVVDQPAANRRGKRMFYEGDEPRRILTKLLQQQRAPRWRRK